jgi:hypothetical protein
MNMGKYLSLWTNLSYFMINMYPSLLKVSSKLIFRKEVQLFNLNTSHFITIELMSGLA